MVNSRNRFESLDVLRGCAAAAVCAFHFSRGDFLNGGALEHAARYGYLGVQAFFVISGFVIPLALSKAEPCIRTGVRFIAARFIRLYPTYLLTILMIISLNFASSLSSLFRGSPVVNSYGQILANLTLTADLFHYPWLNPVFWTLAIEAQFYIFIVCAIPLITNTGLTGRLVTLGGMIVLSSALPIAGTVLPYLSLFAVGIVAFCCAKKMLAPWVGILLITAALAAQWMTAGLACTIAALISTCFIYSNFPSKIRPLVYLGTISYSLYLVHVPVGGRAINLLERYTTTTLARIGSAAAAFVISLAAATTLYWIVERWSHHAASGYWQKRMPAGASVRTLASDSCTSKSAIPADAFRQARVT